jgi:hypothetical protein
VGKRGARLAHSIFEIAVVCNFEWYDRSSCDQPRSSRSSFRLAAKRSKWLTPQSIRRLSHIAKRHIVKFFVCCESDWLDDLCAEDHKHYL